MSNRKDEKLQEQQREHLPAAVYEAAVEKAQWHSGSVSLTLWCDRSRTASCQRSDQTYGVYCSVRMRRSADERKKAEKVPLKVTIKKIYIGRNFPKRHIWPRRVPSSLRSAAVSDMSSDLSPRCRYVTGEKPERLSPDCELTMTPLWYWAANRRPLLFLYSLLWHNSAIFSHPGNF